MLQLRPIQPADSPQVAHIIRTVMTEFGAVGPGFSIEDPEVDAMYEAYATARSLFLVVEDASGQVVGCGGIAPLTGGDPAVCELRKMYFLPAARGYGMGQALVQQLEDAARARGFEQMYLETIAGMEAANRLYQRMLFEPLSGAMGNTGHSSCGLFYVKQL
jgi:putative acetyltransferase